MSLEFKKPKKTLLVSGDPLSDLSDTDKVVKNFKLRGIQPGVFIQHPQGDYEEFSAIDYNDLIDALVEKQVFMSTAQRVEDVKAGISLFAAYDKLQEHGLTLDVGEGDDSGKIVVKYDPKLNHLHPAEDDD